ncbi:Zn-dependent peptidase ImmA (M78 family) [Salirhabdus euzebyi]|uniref:Zn-dependent peptidase ImmA (M78 family) n=1 Tax=Salirhabdus euzebyi TaxID=394506 RepID=A0A841PT45_9BACI|nr:ImmA/IrrE family metallo-endopeptidase [Salirhabdus euzebyi]MBB6451999.1 Zn-dependent peptidase ImmA (M78 family) [Salirhabdus euzebyi]
MSLQIEEKEANAFAMALLMPEGLVRKQVAKYINDEHGIDQENDENIKKLADLFQVSEQLMLIRLSQLGYFESIYKKKYK